MALLLSFGLSSLLLTAAGVYSMVAEMVSLKAHEIAIRIALGTGRLGLVRKFTGEMLRFVLAGEIAGVAACLFIGSTVSSLLYAVEPGDPLVLGFVLSSVLVVSAVAASIPAWIASGKNPRSMLR